MSHRQGLGMGQNIVFRFLYRAKPTCRFINGRQFSSMSVFQLPFLLTSPPKLRFIGPPALSNKRYITKGPEDEDQEASALVTEKYFSVDNTRESNKESFNDAIDIFTHRDTRRRGSVEFIYAAMRNMETFGVHRDLKVYKKLIDVMPKGKMIPENRLQSDFFHYPKQQQCMVDLLQKMERNRIIPDEETGDMILNVFGKYSTPFKRYCRMMYWMPKFKNKSPWPLPFEVPNDAQELAKLAIKQITSVDPMTNINVIKTEDVEDSLDKTWIVSGQSPDQSHLISELATGTALYVEGGFRVWLRDAQVTYFILRGPAIPRPPPMDGEPDDLHAVRRWMDGVKGDDPLVVLPNVHQQEDGTILGCCATGTSSRDSLLSWVRAMERDNPSLEKMVVMFTLQSPLGPVIPVTETNKAAAPL